LKQSPQEWYAKLCSYLILYNFKVSNTDHSLFTKIEGNNITIVLVYIDDIIITRNDQEELKELKFN
jgi:Reverse transcriptase (RNA-dependent DNA polymerase)